MTLKVGSKGYLQLGGRFSSPHWREALVVGIQPNWLQCLVQCSQAESKETQLTTIEVEEKHFCLVEAGVRQLLSGVTEPSMDLEVNTTELLKAGLTTLHSEDELHYATASDHKEKRKSRRKQISSTSSSEQSEGEEEDLATSLRRTWLGSGIGEEGARRPSIEPRGGRKQSKQFALIEKKKESTSPKAEDHEALLRAATSKDPIQGLIALQLAQMMDKGRKGSKRRSKAKSPHSSSTESSSSSSEADKYKRGHAKAVEKYRRSGKRMFRSPLRHVRKFVKELEADLGAEGNLSGSQTATEGLRSGSSTIFNERITLFA